MSHFSCWAPFVKELSENFANTPPPGNFKTTLDLAITTLHQVRWDSSERRPRMSPRFRGENAEAALCELVPHRGKDDLKKCAERP